ncbi:CDP-glycerol:glycerophosphate glycerophosphotransferase [Staphylococcus debuckii]|uniref:CDP-glycerol:glycerophosphate glycerophosphotransferase n=1 Tax=Staphylococcus debuckii TaxID=2044912 RepID=A0ABU9EVI4_9STAP
MNDLTVIITYYNSEEYIRDCIESLKQQRNQNFDVIIVNDGSTDDSETILKEALKDYDKSIHYINLPENQGHAHARNLAMQDVTTPYFMFLDADDQLATYAINFYLKNINGLDALIAPINNFSVNRPQYIDPNKVRLEYMKAKHNPNSFLRKNTACNILFKTAIVQAHNLQFDEHLKTYVDNSFVVDYLPYVNRFVRIFGFPFYYRGEVYDPFETEKLTAQDADELFEDYADSYLHTVQKTKNKKVKRFLTDKTAKKIRHVFDPAQKDIGFHYAQHENTLVELARKIKRPLLEQGGALFKVEMLFLMLRQPKAAYTVNRTREWIRLMKNIVLNQKGKNRSIYELTDAPENVENTTIVFETFGGKNYSDSPKYIYEYMQEKYPYYNYVWSFKKPSAHAVPGNAQKVKRGSKAYYKAYSDAHYWVANARMPLYLNKKANQTYIQTWHGTPLKRLANDMKVVRMPGTTTSAYKRHFKEETERWDYLISPNRYSTEIFESAFWMNPERILEIGYPRNDVLVNRQDDQAYLNEIRENLNIPQDKKVITYAPTWRDDEFIKRGQYLFKLQIDLDHLQQQIGDEYVILLRMHYLIANALDLSGYEDFAIDVSNYEDTSEIFLISDALITDYSSVMFDYGILKRPQFFFAYDIEKYDKGLRGFYMDYKNDLPGPIFTDPHALSESLKDIPKVKRDYQEKIDAFYDRFCSIENGKASQYIGDMIHNHIEQNK